MAVLLTGLARKGAFIRDGIRYGRLDADYFNYEEKGTPFRVPYGGIVLAQGLSPAGEIAEELAEKGIEVISAGDCVQPRTALHAVSEGFLAGYRI